MKLHENMFGQTQPVILSPGSVCIGTIQWSGSFP